MTAFGMGPFPHLSCEPDWHCPLMTSNGNTLLASDRPNLWDSKALATRLLGATPCQSQGKIQDRLRHVALGQVIKATTFP